MPSFKERHYNLAQDGSKMFIIPRKIEIYYSPVFNHEHLQLSTGKLFIPHHL
jgi:hypothetical protein